jgi:hypothetical protein
VETHRVYVCAAGGATAGQTPEDNPNVWVDDRPTNGWAMFDKVVSTQTVVASPLVMVLKPGFINAICMAGLDGTYYDITVLDETGGVVVFHQEGSLEDDPPGDYWEWFFGPYKPAKDLWVENIPPYPECEVTITLTNTAGSVKVGIVQLGDLKPLGDTLAGAQAKPVDFSYIDVDDFGNNVIRKGKSAKDMSVRALLPLEEANEVIDTINDLLGVPCFWRAGKRAAYRGLRPYGLGSANVSFDHPNHVLVDITVKGLI